METNNTINKVHCSFELIIEDPHNQYTLTTLPIKIPSTKNPGGYPITADLTLTRIKELENSRECHYMLTFDLQTEAEFQDALSIVGQEILNTRELPKLFNLANRQNTDDGYSNYIPGYIEILEQFNYQTRAYAPENFRTMLLKLNESLHALGHGWDTNE